MGRSYPALIANHDLLLIQLQSYAASGEPEIRAFTCGAVRGHRSLRRATARHSGRRRCGSSSRQGMLCNLVAALGLVDLDELWGDLQRQPGRDGLPRSVLRPSAVADPPTAD